VCPVHFTHPTRADQGFDLIGAEAFAGLELRLFVERRRYGQVAETRGHRIGSQHRLDIGA
jgi:hypothetical protein